MNGRNLSTSALNARRREAVQLRLQGVLLTRISKQLELSIPTIIAAHKAYLAHGWKGIDVKPRGRPSGDGRMLPVKLEQAIIEELLENSPEACNAQFHLWSCEAVRYWIESRHRLQLGERTAARYLERWGFNAEDPYLKASQTHAAPLRSWMETAWPSLIKRAKQEKAKIFWGGETRFGTAQADEGSVATTSLLFAHSRRGKLHWIASRHPVTAESFIDFFKRLIRAAGRKVYLILHGSEIHRVASIAEWLAAHRAQIEVHQPPVAPGTNYVTPRKTHPPANKRTSMTPTHLQRLEAESIHIMREVVAEADNPVMLYSIGKDSAVMLHLAKKAFYPAPPPFPLLHVDTRWKFREMYSFRDRMAQESGMDLIVHINPEGIEKDINPFTHGSAIHTDIMKTEGLKQALDKYGFDAAFGGARRDEEKSRAKERIFSFRTDQHRWDPKNQRPELWKLYNARKQKGESIRVFPISNWTELDIWQYIYLNNVPIVPLYYSAERPVVMRDGSLIMVDDERMPLKSGEVPMLRKVRFRTLGCYPLTGAVESTADTLPAIIQEMLLTKTSERQGRVIDHDSAASMEKKKQEGYF